MAWWDIGLQFTVKFKSVKAEHSGDIRADDWSELEKKWYELKWYSRSEKKAVSNFNTALKNAMVRIWKRAKKYMIDYAPIDESRYKDDVVLKENIDYDWQWDSMVIGSVNIPYATRRNYENKLHPDKRRYVQKTFENHYDEYWRILNEEVKNLADDFWDKMLKELRKSSWAWMPHRYF